MNKQLKFSEHTYYVGKNGEGKMLGVEIMTGEFVTYMTPINSKNQTARCELQIPYADLEQVILTLQEALEKRNRPYDK